MADETTERPSEPDDEAAASGDAPAAPSDEAAGEPAPGAEGAATEVEVEVTAEPAGEPAEDSAPELRPAPAPAPSAATAERAAASEPVEDLRTEDAAFSFKDVLTDVRQRKTELDHMPDGPRPPTGQRYKRRKLIVDFPLQLSYVGVYIATVVLLAVGFAALNLVFTAVYKRALKIQQQGIGPFQESPDLFILGLLNFTFVMLLLIGMAVYAIIQSHRVAGPAYRFRKAVSQIQRRDYDFYLQLRRRDYLHDLAEQLNVLNNALKAKDIIVADAALRLNELSKKADPKTAERLQEVVADLGDVVLPIPEEPAPAGSDAAGGTDAAEG